MGFRLVIFLRERVEGRTREKSYLNFNIVRNFMLQIHWKFRSFFHSGGQKKQLEMIFRVCGCVCESRDEVEGSLSDDDNVFLTVKVQLLRGWSRICKDEGIIASLLCLRHPATLAPYLEVRRDFTFSWIYFQHIHPLSCSVARKSSFKRYGATNFWFHTFALWKRTAGKGAGSCI